MSESQTYDLSNNPVYVTRAERAAADKPVSRNQPMGAVAQSRVAGLSSRQAMAEAILSQGRDLVAGRIGKVHYKPMTVAGVELKLEPLQPSVLFLAIHEVCNGLGRDALEPLVQLGMLPLDVETAYAV